MILRQDYLKSKQEATRVCEICYVGHQIFLKKVHHLLSSTFQA